MAILREFHMGSTCTCPYMTPAPKAAKPSILILSINPRSQDFSDSKPTDFLILRADFSLNQNARGLKAGLWWLISIKEKPGGAPNLWFFRGMPKNDTYPSQFFLKHL
ncbi:unnamed protein product [Citrullus colocynthis]|uniref:Uncharacterized protein n=1 Tax=Citrullus colocynthis TaxID=252529 RepID=A0ABP0Y2K6_9ROSI